MGNCCGAPGLFQTKNSQTPDIQTTKKKIKYQQPIEIQKGISIKRNPQTGLFEGFPQQWLDNNKIDIEIDVSKVVNTSHLSNSIRPHPIIPQRILNKIEKKSFSPAIHNNENKPSSKITMATNMSFITNSSQIIHQK